MFSLFPKENMQKTARAAVQRHEYLRFHPHLAILLGDRPQHAVHRD
jgi:hypothetical protein